MPIEVMFEETVRLLAAALQDPHCPPARIDHLAYEAGRLRRKLVDGWRMRDGKPPTRGEGTPRGIPGRLGFGTPLPPAVQPGRFSHTSVLSDDTQADRFAPSINMRGASFYGRPGGRDARQLRRSDRVRRDREPLRRLPLAPLTVSGCRATHCDGCLEALPKAQVHEHHGVLGVTFHLHRAECLAEVGVQA